jgi:hypothetical protein
MGMAANPSGAHQAGRVFAGRLDKVCVSVRHQRTLTPAAQFRGSMAGLCAPLSTLRQYPHGHLRMTRGRCGSLLLHRDGLAPSTPCRSPGALRHPMNGHLRVRTLRSVWCHKPMSSIGLPRSGRRKICRPAVRLNCQSDSAVIEASRSCASVSSFSQMRTMFFT